VEVDVVEDVVDRNKTHVHGLPPLPNRKKRDGPPPLPNMKDGTGPPPLPNTNV